jgi:hypothetical protein
MEDNATLKGMVESLVAVDIHAAGAAQNAV